MSDNLRRVDNTVYRPYARYYIPCAKCGKDFDCFDHDSYDGEYSCTEPHEICLDCNDEFWSKFRKIPVLQQVKGRPVLTLEHLKLIEEYHKISHFKRL
ncbi:MAG: hypothetical protein NHB14_06190 [Desulfosporosinus sp.]|nr:hypothetical protein [Desulfosporosinus sp.]